jgi:hypothetical protein
VASDDPGLVLRLASQLRQSFSQEGIGIAAHGRYLRLTRGTEPEAMLQALQRMIGGLVALQAASDPAIEPGPGR